MESIDSVTNRIRCTLGTASTPTSTPRRGQNAATRQTGRLSDGHTYGNDVRAASLVQQGFSRHRTSGSQQACGARENGGLY